MAAIIQACILFRPVLKIYLLQIFGPQLMNTRLQTQARLMGSFGLNWLCSVAKGHGGAWCFIFKEDVENTYHFFPDCPQFKENFDSVWRHLQLKTLSRI